MTTFLFDSDRERHDYVASMAALIAELCAENECTPVEIAAAVGFTLNGVEVVN